MNPTRYHFLKDLIMLFKLLGEEFSILKKGNMHSQSHLSKIFQRLGYKSGVTAFISLELVPIFPLRQATKKF